jgi:hypothetical protein
MSEMRKRLMVSMVAVIAGLTFFPILRAQTAAPKAAGDEVKRDKWNSVPARKGPPGKSAPAPRRNLSGTWWDAKEFEGTPGVGGRQVSGNYEHPALLPGRVVDGGQLDETGITHPLPYTPAGLAALKANKPSGPGVRAVPAALANDPYNICDPMGFPQMELFEFRTIELAQMANHVIFLNGYYGQWRIIWTDGRELPKDAEPRWNGYSVGNWVDDYTFVVQTVGMDERTWLDHAGRPHSKDLKVEEVFHRVDNDHMELTVKIDDPKMYTEPWLALNKMPLQLQRPDFDIPELLCSPSDAAAYNKIIGDVVAAPKK